MVKLKVDEKIIEAEEGANLLKACLDNDIYIPNLCYLEDMPAPRSSCRLCFVRIEGAGKPVAACTAEVKEGMAVITDDPEVRRLQKTAFELLISVHNVDCRNCVANKKCGLQRISRFLKIPLKAKNLGRLERKAAPETDQPYLVYHPDKCVLCGKCEYTCRKLHGRPFLSLAGRSIETVITFYGEKDESALPCGNCYACVDICPVGALLRKDKINNPKE